jgi:WD40 repeat protein/tRNA A-37 threonylcarbamoyl transferase component Bud32
VNGTPTDHPPVEQLNALVQGMLGDADAATLGAHVWSCTVCLRTLEQLPDPTDPFLSKLRAVQGAVPSSPAPALELLEGTTFLPRGRHPPARPEEKDGLPTVPGYEILAELGRGGMGVVYKARHERLNRLVALKMIRPGGYAEERARFKLEAEAVARLQHPNIVQIHEVGEADGRPYCALEFVEGGSLAQKLDGKPIAPREAARLVEVLARAMQVAHSRNLVHRDLKPANVLLTADGVPKIADFGLARQLDRPAEAGGLTETGAVVGTPSYMAPEQASGRRQDVGSAADVYALGAILYECVTGRPPFQGATPLETLDQVRHQEPVPPSRCNPRVPRDLETVCLKCLRKEPEQRYASARELGEDLGRFLRGEPVTAKVASPWERLAKWARRRPAAAAAATLAVLTLFLGIGGGLAWWQYRAAEAARERETGLRQAAEVAQERLDQVLYLQRVQGAVREWQADNVARARELLEECPVSRRGWEWHYARRLLYPLREMAGLKQWADDVQFTPDGKRVISSGRLDGLRVWDPVGGRELFYLEGTQPQAEKLGGFGGATNAAPVRFLIDPGRGEVLANPRGGAGPLGVWDLATGTRRGERPVDAGPERTCLAIDPKGTWLAYGCGGGNAIIREVYVVDATTGRQLAKLPGHPSPVMSLAASPDGRLLASGCKAGTIKVWDMKDLKEQRTLEMPRGGVAGLAFRPGTTQLIAIGQQGQLRCWDVASGAECYRVDTRPHRLTALAVQPETSSGRTGRRLACGTDTGEVQTYDAQTGERQEVYRGHLEPFRAVTALAYSPDGTRLVSAGRDRALLVWDATRGPEAAQRQVPVPRGTALALDGRTATLVTGSEDGVRRWELATGRPAGQQRGQTGAVFLAVAARADRVAWAGWDGTVRVWDWQADRRVLELVRVADRVQALALGPDGRALVVSGRGGQGAWLRCWEVDTGRETPLAQPPHPVNHLAFTPDGRALALADDNDELLVWRFPEGGEAFHYWGGAPIGAVTFSADGALLAAGIGPRVRVWGVDGWQEVLNGWGRSNVRQLAFHPDGKRLAAAGSEVTVWDLTVGQQALTLPASTPQVGLGFTADGSGLVGATLDGSLTIWEGPAPVPP